MRSWFVAGVVGFPTLSSHPEQLCLASSDLLHTHLALAGTCCYYRIIALLVQDRKRVSLPRKPDRHSRNLIATLTIVKVLEFSSQTLRSGVVVLATDGPPNSARLFLRGAPAVIRDIVQPSSLPPDFNEVGSLIAV